MLINLPMAEARDFHCYFHVFENLGKRSIPSDHAAVRMVIQKPTTRGHQGKRMLDVQTSCFLLNLETKKKQKMTITR